MTSTALLLLLAACSDSPPDDTGPDTDPGTEAALEDLAPLLDPLLDEYDVPAIGAARIEGGELTAYGAVGVRAFGTEAAVTRDDLWHLGSDTKAMTATLYATFVEDVYLIFASVTDDNKATVQVYVKPLVRWVWIGGSWDVPERRRACLRP